jgi:hypothetical protein
MSNACSGLVFRFSISSFLASNPTCSLSAQRTALRCILPSRTSAYGKDYQSRSLSTIQCNTGYNLCSPRGWIPPAPASKITVRTLKKKKVSTPKTPKRQDESKIILRENQGLLAKPQIYKLNWRDWSDETGIPLPDGELDAKKITSIFGKGVVSTNDGNYILKVLQWRRLSGALVEYGVKFPEDGYNRSVYTAGLEFLRNQYPVDEEANAEKWINEESRRMEADEIRERAARLGIQKRQTELEYVLKDEGNDPGLQGSAYGRAMYGRSVLEEIQDTHAQRQAERRKKEEEERAKAEAEGRIYTGPREIASLKDVRQWAIDLGTVFYYFSLCYMC